MLIRTSLRLPADLKKAAEQRALDTDSSLQAIFIQALREFLEKKDQAEAHKMIFPDHGLGVPLDTITRDMISSDDWET